MSIRHFIYENKEYGVDSFQEFDLLYRAFIKDRERSFKSFLAADYFNLSEQVRDLFQRIQRAERKGISVLRGAAILKAWKPMTNKDLEGKDLESVLQGLIELGLDFIAHQEMKENKVTKQRIIQRSLRHKQLGNFLTRSVKSTNRILAKQSIGAESIALKLSLTLETYYDSATDHEKHGFDLLNSLEQQVEYLYQLTATKLKCEAENLKMAARKPAKLSPQKNTATTAVDLLELYQLNLRLHQAPDGFSQAAFTDFKKAFLAVHDLLDETERFILCKYTINAINRGIKKGEASLSLLFEWTKYRVQWTPTYIQEVSVNDFLNTINIACTCQALDFAENYLDKYYHRLPLSQKEAEKIQALGRAETLFLKEEYAKLLLLLRENFPRHTDPHYSILFRIKVLRLKACTAILLLGDKATPDAFSMAEKEYQTALDDLRLYSSRSPSSMPRHYQNAYQSFRQLVETILRNRNKPYSKKEKKEFGEQLLREVDETRPIVARDWLKEVIATYFVN